MRMYFHSMETQTGDFSLHSVLWHACTSLYIPLGGNLWIVGSGTEASRGRKMLHRLGEAEPLPKSLHGYKEASREFYFGKMRVKAFKLEVKCKNVHSIFQ